MPSRRRLLTSGVGLIAAGLAGCTGGGDEDPGSDAGNGSEATNGTAGDDATPYEVTVEPAGTHTFEEVPETYATIPGAWLDLSMAFGIQPEGLAYLERHPTEFYDQLGIEFDEEEILIYGDGESARSYDKEVFYEMDADIHLMDPRMLQSYSGWSDADLQEIEENVAPYLGSYIRFDFNGEEPYYDLYEALENHSTASELRAVQEGNVVRASGQFMGPIVHLFSTEALAKQVFPEQFGEWPGDSHEIPDDEQLFDRERMADIVNGNV